jgi:hypothetical protein
LSRILLLLFKVFLRHVAHINETLARFVVEIVEQINLLPLRTSLGTPI